MELNAEHERAPSITRYFVLLTLGAEV